MKLSTVILFNSIECLKHTNRRSVDWEDFKYIVSIQLYFKEYEMWTQHSCHGIITSNHEILTTKSCLANGSSFLKSSQVRIVAYNNNWEYEDIDPEVEYVIEEGKGTIVKVVEIVDHPEFDAHNMKNNSICTF